jgi:hypothetical protein
MKASITSFLTAQSLESIRNARNAKYENHPNIEVYHCVIGTLMIALALEGFANEVGENTFGNWVWERVERLDTPLKWYFASGDCGRTHFDPSCEPLQTVQRLSKIRNRIAHPKIEDMGEEIIIRSKDGTIQRNVPRTQLLKEGDDIIVGAAEMLKDFNYTNTAEELRKAFGAMKEFRDHMGASGFKWIERNEVELNAIVSTPPG